MEPYVIPEPVARYSITQAKAKPEKQATRRRRHVAQSRPNFLQRLVASFINLQKHQPAKSSCKQSRTTSRRS
jgi:hypothetical protein